MAASKENPIYTVYAISDNTKYNLTECVEEINISDSEKQISKRVQLTLANIQTGGRWLSSILKVRDRVYLYANDGEKTEEVWRGFVWDFGYKSSLTSRMIALNCYDNLIYCQESEESKYFSAGKSTKDVISSICSEWGIKLEYTYSSITHSKLPLRGNLYSILTADLLDLVKERTGIKYVVLSEKDVMYIKPVGKNATIYKITAGQNATMTETEVTMEGMITKVKILGKTDDNDRTPVEATVTGKTSQYGTLQKLISRNENTSLADAKKEANSLLKENGEPKRTYTVEGPDIPWIRKGDMVYVNAGNLTGNFIVKTTERIISSSKKKMTLTMEDV